jgi:hypothetical protein
VLHELAKKDKYWRKVAFNICKDKFLADDLVNDMYLALANCNKEINDFYVIVVIKNLFLYHIKQNKMIDLELVKEPITEIFEIDDNEKEILDSLKWWEVELIEMNQQYSLREMQQQLNINYAFIYRTIKKIKDGKKKK